MQRVSRQLFVLRNWAVVAVAAASGVLLLSAAAQAAPAWPVMKEWKQQGGGEKDAAVIAVVEKYAYVPGVPGARRSGEDWFKYLRKTRGVPLSQVTILRDEEVTREDLLGRAEAAAKLVGEGGTLWFVFVGHGAAAKDGSEGVLIGADARQTAESLFARSIGQSAVLAKLAASRAGRIVAVMDSCFSGRGTTGESLGKGLQPLQLKRQEGALDPRLVLLTAAKGDEFAGALPGEERPAFSYLVLGGLRGWAREDGAGEVTGAALQTYAENTLRAVLGGSRKQTPTVEGVATASLGTGWEKGPDLDALVLAGPKLAAVPAISGPSGTMPEAPVWKGPSGAALALAADVEAMEARDKAVQAEEGGSAESKLAAWKALAALGGRNPYKAEAEERAGGWGLYLRKKPAQDAYRAAVKAEKTGSASHKRLAWARLAELTEENPWQEKAKAQQQAWADYEAKEQALAAAGAEELQKLRRVLRLKSVPQEQKDSLVASYRSKYGQVGSLVKSLDEAVAGGGGESGEMVPIPGGSFTMGDRKDSVTVASFALDRTAVTVAAYRACVEAGKCPAGQTTGYWNNQEQTSATPYCNWGKSGRDNHPMNCVDWNAAKTYCEAQGKRLPTEEEREWAARGGEEGRTYPWGNEAPAGQLCWNGEGNDVGKGQRKSTCPVSSYPAGHSKHGVHDLAGNVWEWTSSLYAEGRPLRVVRGGSWNLDDPENMRAVLRDWYVPLDRRINVGVRCSRTQ